LNVRRIPGMQTVAFSDDPVIPQRVQHCASPRGAAATDAKIEA
jgi:hypothetical protein